MRDLNQHPGAVAGLGIATARSPVRQIDQNLDSLLDDLMALLTANARDKTDSARVVLVRRIIKTLRRRQTIDCVPAFQEILQRVIRGHRNGQRQTTTSDYRSRTPRAVYIFGTASRGQKYNSEFRFGRWKFRKQPSPASHL